MCVWKDVFTEQITAVGCFLTSPLKVPFSGSTEESFFFLNTIVIPCSPENSAYRQKKPDPLLSMPPESYAESQHGWAKVSDLSLGCPDACRRQTGWQVPGKAALRHWAGLNLISKSQYTAIPNSSTVSIKNKGKGGEKATSQFSSWLCTHLQLCQLFWRFLQSLKCLTGFALQVIIASMYKS